MPPKRALSKNHSGRVGMFIRCGPDADRLHDATDGAGLDELAGLHRRAILEPLAVHDRKDALGLGLHPARLGQLLERRDAGLVDHEVLAVLHHANAERRRVRRESTR